ncbi:SDR family NAD(P)-dependent oxidoreductase [Actinomadura fulvescens]|uniref:SDR family NAD(P)-dependent oxidoreductase n=1 Tax=Actinomadura fulvescens TaxID=46160 RepID=UPI00397A7400
MGDRAVAIVGVGCRLPGGITGLEGLWAALERGEDLVGQVPPDRFDVDLHVDERGPRLGRSYTGAGGFLDLDVGAFDAAFFGISPKEAAAMDPQQRLLLEMAIEALEDAGIDPEALAGSDTGVFVGISDTSYGTLQMLEPGGTNPYTMSGVTLSIASNRLSQVLDLRGPSMSVDTACSSSLLAVERGWRTLVEGGSRVVLAGGVNVLLSPGPYVGFSQASMLSPTGRCRAFSAEADGFVRAEGGGVVVLKRLADAVADGDRIHGVVVGAGTNNDGRTIGLSMPNPDAQEDLLRRVYAEAGVAPDDVVYVEAHGTGTLVGDPAECQSLGRALGQRRSCGPLPIGSVKTNMGHLEPASGMPGLFKALLVLKHRVVPASLHADTLNPGIDFEGLGLRVASRTLPLPASEGRAVVGVNSFGFGGANVHVAVTAPPAPAQAGEAPTPAAGLPVVVTARTRPALEQAVASAAAALAATDERDFYDLAYTASRRRGKYAHRAAVVADSAAAAARALAGPVSQEPGERASGQPDQAGAVAAAGALAGAVAVEEATEHGRVALVFSGNGAQWAGMGGDLLADEVFGAAVTAVDAELAALLGWSVRERLALPAERWRLSATEVAQPLLFTVQVGVVEMLRAAGVRPCAVLGHSVGEVAAAYAAGALSLPQAATVIAERAKAQALTQGLGRMAAVGLPEAEARRLQPAYPGVEISAVNTDRDVTVAGPAQSVRRLGEDLVAQGVFFRELDLDYPFHSAAMDPIRTGLETGLQGLQPGPARVGLVSTVTGAPVQGPHLDAAYWWQNVRRPVAFAAAVKHVIDQGCDVLVEVGPHPVLRSYLTRIASTAQARVVVGATLRRGEPGPARMRTAIAHMIAAGAQLDWDGYFPRPGVVRPLPAYPWQRERHWIGRPAAWSAQAAAAAAEHPMLGQRLMSPKPEWGGELDPGRLPWLHDHRVGGVQVLPGTGYLEMMIAAGRLALPEAAEAIEVDRVDISRAMVLPSATDTLPSCVAVALDPQTGVVTVASAEDKSKHPRENSRGRVRPLLRSAPPQLDVDALRARITTPIDVADFYARTAEAHMAWGPHFQALTGLWHSGPQPHADSGGKEVLGSYSCPAQEDDRYHAHPVVLDVALQAGVSWLVEELASGTAYMPAAIGAVRVWGRPAAQGLVHVRERSRTQEEFCWDITQTDLQGRVTVEIRQCRLRRVRGWLNAPLARYQMVLRAAPRKADRPPAAAGSAATPAEVLAAASASIDRARSAWHELEYQPYAEHAEEAFAHALARALTDDRALGAADNGDRTATTFTPQQLAQTCRAPHHRQMVHAALPLLERHGLLERVSGTHLRWAAPPRDINTLHQRLIRHGADFCAHTALTVRIGSRLPELLSGRRTAGDLLAGGGGADLLEQFHDIGPVSSFVNKIVRALMEEVVFQWPADRPLRVLEVGAGSGGTTAVVLPVLPADRTRYTVTDVAETALTRLGQRFRDHDFVDCGRLDLDRDPGGQGLPLGAFDVVIAVDTLHLTEDLTASLGRLSALLAPGGRLLAAEPHRAELLLPVYGLLADFWRLRDHDLRPQSPLLSRDQWPAVLAEAGFTGIVQTGDDREPGRSDFSVLLAAAPAAPTGPAASTVAPQPVPAQAAPNEPGPNGADVWIIAADDDAALATELESVLAKRGGHIGRSVLSNDPDHWVCQVPSHARTATFTLLLGDPPPTEPGTGEGTDSQPALDQITRRIAALRAIALACEQLPRDMPVSLWLVARPCGALPEPDLPSVQTYPQDAAVWGAARTLGNEHPQLAVRCLCLHSTGHTAQDAARLGAELLAPGEEHEILLTRQGRFVPRLQQAPAATIAASGAVAPDMGFRLAVHDPGLSYQLAWHQARRAAPAPGQVAIDVRAVGLNYRDVMRAVNLLPTEAIESVFGWHEFGLECAGIVNAVGPGVSHLKPGDRVAATGPVGIGDHAVLPAWAAGPIPDTETFTRAAAKPLGLATAYHALVRCARLKAGETVLMHGGAGSVGLAALHIARIIGAPVIATAGTPAKRDLLRALGAAHVLDSRSLHFAEQVRDLTAGQGVDVVVNSLAGEALARGVEALRHGGRFVELGKRDFYQNHPLLLRPFADNLSFYGVDIGTLMWKDPDAMATEMAEIAAFFLSLGTGAQTPGIHDKQDTADAALEETNAADFYRCATTGPLPLTVFPASRVNEAFALTRHSRHIGKIVISFDPHDEPVPVQPERTAPRFDPDGTYLVTGGLSGFGAATARWLAAHGARRLALVSRRGPHTPEASGLLEDLRGVGVTVRAHAADAADATAMRQILDDLDSEGHPVRGVVHAAMQLDDAPLTDLSDERIRAVLHPKIAGAMVLDKLTHDRPLDMFVMYSSVAGLGNIGQAPYAAANLYLEALARHRRRHGRPALTIALGPLAEAGVLADGTRPQVLARFGGHTIRPVQAFAAIADMLAEQAEVAMVGCLDWGRLSQNLPGLRRPMTAALLPSGLDEEAGQPQPLEILSRLDSDQAQAFLVEQLTHTLSEVMLIPADQIDDAQRLNEYGMDSLMGAQLLASVRARYGVDIPPMELLRSGGTVTEIAQVLMLHLGLTTSDTPVPQQPAAAAPAP